MSATGVAQERAKVVERYGEWTSHNIYLGDDVYTIGADVVSAKLRRILQIVSDLAPRPLKELRVLDLACLEGQYAIELANHGARVVGIEGREANIEKARFAQRALGLDSLELVQDDVRNLSREQYGEFDVVLCLGILYHLDEPDVFRFVESIAEVCTGFAVFDTYVGVKQTSRYTYKETAYWGRKVHEHEAEASTEARLRDLWASLDNPKSFWISRHSLYNLLFDSGFTSAYECHIPVEPSKLADRLTLVAVAGDRQRPISQPSGADREALHWPEQFRPVLSRYQRSSAVLSKRLSGLFPSELKRGVKSLLRSVGLMSAPTEPWDWDKPWEKRG